MSCSTNSSYPMACTRTAREHISVEPSLCKPALHRMRITLLLVAVVYIHIIIIMEGIMQAQFLPCYLSSPQQILSKAVKVSTESYSDICEILQLSTSVCWRRSNVKDPIFPTPRLHLSFQTRVTKEKLISDWQMSLLVWSLIIIFCLFISAKHFSILLKVSGKGLKSGVHHLETENL